MSQNVLFLKYFLYTMSLTHHRQIIVTCAALLVLGVIKLTQCATMIIHCDDDTTLQSYIEVGLGNAPSLLDTECYRVERLNHFHIAGYDNDRNGPAIEAILSAFISTKKYNVFLMNWEKEASSIISINPITYAIFYVISAIPEAYNIGIQFGSVLVELANKGLNISRTLITGHSLGAQVAGIAARTSKARGVTVDRIIGLDAAGPGFGTIELPSLSASDADAVLSVLTDPGELGINETLGTANILVNYETFTNFFTLPNSPDRAQPGCTNASCSHNRCWELLVETILNPNSAQPLLACKAPKVWSWLRGEAICSDNVLLGPEWDKTKEGNYFMATNSAPLYGQGMAGCCPSP